LKRIPARQLVTLWQHARAAQLDLYSAAAIEGLQRLAAWPPGATSEQGSQALESLRALTVQAREAPRGYQRVSTSVTAPIRAGFPSIADDLRTLIKGARKELMVVGFDFGEQAFASALHEAARRGIAVTVVGDRNMAGIGHLAAFWPSDITGPAVYVGVEPDLGRVFRVHAKTVVADRMRALVGSANFTAGGLRNNLEFALLVEGPCAQELVQLVDDHVARGYLVPLRRAGSAGAGGG